MEDLVRALRAKEICIRVGVGHKKNGSVSFDVFDMTPQVTHEGAYQCTEQQLIPCSKVLLL